VVFHGGELAVSKLYRERIYGQYVDGRENSVAPSSVEGFEPRAPYIRRLIQRHFPENHNATIMDLGCGHGALVYFARQAGYTKVRGVDGSSQQVESAHRLGIQGVDGGDVMGTLSGLESESHDCIIMFDVIEHFARDELIRVVDEVRRVLKPGGRWLIHAPNAESPFGARMRFWDFTHEMAFTRTSIAQVLYSSEFSDVTSYEDEPIPHGVTSGIRWMLWKALRLLLRLYLAIETGDRGRSAIFSQNLLTVAIK